VTGRSDDKANIEADDAIEADADAEVRSRSSRSKIRGPRSWTEAVFGIGVGCGLGCGLGLGFS